MLTTIQLPNESSETTKRFLVADQSSPIGVPVVSVQRASPLWIVPQLEQRLPEGYSSIAEIIKRRKAMAGGAEGLLKASKVLANAMHRPGTVAHMRLSRGLSQQALSKLCGLAQSHISRIETGEDVLCSSLAQLARGLAAPISEVQAAYQITLELNP